MNFRLVFISIATIVALLPHLPGVQTVLSRLPEAFRTEALFAHSQAGTAFALIGLASLLISSLQIARARRLVASFDAVTSPRPLLLNDALERLQRSETRRACSDAVRFVDTAKAMCFTLPGVDRIVISRGFLQSHSPESLSHVLSHEYQHLKHRDGLRGVLWRCAFAALMLPGSEVIERALHRRRERRATALAAERDPAIYLRAFEISSKPDTCFVITTPGPRSWLALGIGLAGLAVLIVHSTFGA